MRTWLGPRPRPALPARRRLAGWLVLAVGLPILTVAVTTAHADRLAVSLLLYLGLVLAAAVVGGHGPGITGALASATVANYFIVPPLHRLTIAKTTDLVALVMFVAVAVTVSTLVNRSARLSTEAARARAEAEALAVSTATLVAELDPLPSLLEKLCDTLRLEGAAVYRPEGPHWHTVAAAGHVGTGPDEAQVVSLGTPGGPVLSVRSREPLTGADRGLLESLAGQLTVALAARELQAEAARADALEQADTLRTAILQAVSHDLRTPLSSIKAAVTSLLGDEIEWPAATVRQFLSTIDADTDRLNRLVGNLLDMSRLQAGAVQLRLGPVALEDVVGSALASLSEAAGVVVDIPESTPLARADAALAERVVANLLSNALTHSPDHATVRVEGHGDGSEVVLRIVDRGPGVPADTIERIVEPFQRLGDTAADTGVGLGLAVARGFTAAMGGRLLFTRTPGGGLTASVVLPVHQPAPSPAGRAVRP